MSPFAPLLAAVGTAALLALVLEVLGRLRPRPCALHLGWGLVLAKLVLPPLFVLSLPLVPPFPGSAPPDAGAVPARWLGGALLATWAVGTLVALARAGRRLSAHRRLLSVARPAPRRVARLVAELAPRLGVRRPPAPRVVDALHPPAVIGFGPWARLLLPAGLLERLDDDALRQVLAHELAHVARRDPWWRPLELLVLAVHWWNPLARRAAAQLRRWEEHACDARVLATWPDRRRAYAAALLDTVSWLSGAPTSSLATGLAGGALAERLRAVLRGPRPTPGERHGLGLALVALGWLVVGLGPPAAPARWNVRATDPAGAFALELEGERVVAVHVDGVSVAASCWDQDGERLRIRAHHHATFEVRVHPGRRITWRARAAPFPDVES